MNSPTPLRPCWVEIDTGALEDNLRFLREVAPAQAELLAIIKADAYGHTIAHCAPAAARAGARWLGVTTVDEAILARTLCPSAQILVMGGIFAGQGSAVAAHRLTAIAWQLDQFDELASAARAARTAIPIHLEIDTGMTRQGARADALLPLLARLQPGSPLRLQAVMTHLFASDESIGAITAEQLSQLERALAAIRDAGLQPEYLSVGASAALLGPERDQIAALAARFGLTPMLRPGLALYGLAPRYQPPFGSDPPQLARAHQSLRPVLSWKTRIETLHRVEPGSQVGYNGTFVATEPMRVALLPVGYADGLDRRLGNRFAFLVRGRSAPLIGRISMDQCVIDVTDIPDAQLGDEVVLLGRQADAVVSAFDHADAGGTIPWEVFTRISSRVPRIAL